MSLVSPILRQANGNDGGGPRYIFWCPGCKAAHQAATGGGPGPRWGFNGNVDKPTFTPSVLVRGSDFTPKGRADYQAWLESGCPDSTPLFESMDTVCHTFITDGQIQFLSDCTHALAGQTVPIPEWPR